MARPRLFAEGTTVAPERTRAEIETMLKRYGYGEGFAYQATGRGASIMFQARGRAVRFDVAIPQPTEASSYRARRARRNGAFRDGSPLEAEVRRRWRALALVLKGKLEAVASGVMTFEREFLANIVLPGDGRTVGEVVAPGLAEVYAKPGSSVRLLPEAGGTFEPTEGAR